VASFKALSSMSVGLSSSSSTISLSSLYKALWSILVASLAFLLLSVLARDAGMLFVLSP
jgi:hypothetical protein